MPDTPEYPFSIHTPDEIACALAAGLKDLRLRRRWKRATLAARSGVTEASLRRFETTGKVSLANLLKLAAALGRLGEWDKLFHPPPAASIAELERRQSAPAPKRGRI